MDDNLKPTQEELQEEENALKESKVDEIRSSVIEKYGLEEGENDELIDKLTKDIVAQQKSFGKVVSQKKSWREKALNSIKKEGVKKEDKNLTPEEIRQQAESAIEEKFIKRDLDDLEVSDTLKEEVKKLAKLKGLSIRQAFKDPYIAFLKTQEDNEKKLDKSIITGKKNGKPTLVDPTKALNPDDFDFSTAEGRKAWEDAKKAKTK